MALITVGKPAPRFRLKDAQGKSHDLKDFLGRTVVLYFYPKDDTSDCTTQACQFRDHHPDFSKIKAVVLGVSPDDEASHRAFSEKHALPFMLLVDARNGDGTPPTCDAYGVWQPRSMYGRSFMGVIRTTYLIGPDGRIARRWDRVKVNGHVPEVLNAVKALHAGQKLTEVTGRLKPLRRGAARGRNRAQGGHPGYSGVLSVKRKATRNRSTATQAKARRVSSRGKPGVRGAAVRRGPRSRA